MLNKAIITTMLFIGYPSIASAGFFEYDDNNAHQGGYLTYGNQASQEGKKWKSPHPMPETQLQQLQKEQRKKFDDLAKKIHERTDDEAMSDIERSVNLMEMQQRITGLQQKADMWNGKSNHQYKGGIQ